MFKSFRRKKQPPPEEEPPLVWPGAKSSPTVSRKDPGSNVPALASTDVDHITTNPDLKRHSTISERSKRILGEKQGRGGKRLSLMLRDSDHLGDETAVDDNLAPGPPRLAPKEVLNKFI